MLELSRSQVLAHRRRAGHLETRLSAGKDSLERAAHAGLQDSMPRAAVFSAHARVEGVGPFVWDEPPFIQVWGPRFNAYVIAERDRAVFTLGRLSDQPAAVEKAYRLADAFEAAFGDARVTLGQAGRAIGGHHTQLRYAAPTGRLQIQWEGGGTPLVWAVPAPAMDPVDARLELARRYLHILGPGDGIGFGDWAGIKAPRATATIEALAVETVPTVVDGEPGVILAADEESFRSGHTSPASARLLPSGDSYWLLQGRHRELLVPDPARRPELWTSRVWPGAVMVGGEIVGVWRRSGHDLTISPWREMSAREMAAVEEEAHSLPMPDAGREMRVSWSGS